MAIITLTTDMGIKDYYVASLKGSIYSQLQDITIVDISHHIPPFDIAQAAFVLKNCYRDFPKGTIHIMGVNPELGADVLHIIVEYSGQWFIGADNGIFSLLFDKQPEAVYELTILPEVDEYTFPTKSVFVKAACHIARGGTPEIIGKRIEKIQIRQIFRPVADEHAIRGGVQYIDEYGNVITNITKSLFNEVGKGRPFTIYFRRASYDINTISKSYNDVPEGEKVALFSSSGHLEIAINKGVEGNGGGANKLFGLKINDIVTIQFED
ncbi:MAG: S-adenosyl-l-methionine hydroxide adenosyltransferase family protein [Flavobacteriales bacterium]